MQLIVFACLLASASALPILPYGSTGLSTGIWNQGLGGIGGYSLGNSWNLGGWPFSGLSSLGYSPYSSLNQFFGLPGFNPLLGSSLYNIPLIGGGLINYPFF